MQTIHAFCTQLLHQFPFEANVAARFTVLDEAEQTQLLERLTLDVLLEGAAEPDSPLGRALTTAMTAAADQTFRDVVREAIGTRDASSQWVTERRQCRCRDREFIADARHRSRRDNVESDRRRNALPARPSHRRNGRLSPQFWRRAARAIASRRERFGSLAALP